MSGKTITLHNCLVGHDCKKRVTKLDTQAKLKRKQSAKVGMDCKKRITKRGFWAWLMSWK